MNFKYALLILFVIVACEDNNNSNCDLECADQFLLDEENCQCICNLDCEGELILDENNCECYDYREQFIGQWQLTKYYAVTHPFDPSQGDLTWVGEVTLGENNNTLIVPRAPIPEDNPSGYCYCYEFEIDQSGLINENSYDADDFNYFFEGYITIDSLYYSSLSGSPFSSFSQTVYGFKIN